ncbi:hypothetical protein M9458_040759, partial [Cirrhinus mrigala]
DITAVAGMWTLRGWARLSISISIRSVSAYAEVHDPLNILDDTSRKTTRPYYTEL